MSYTNSVYSAEFCNITFQGNNRRQQDALFLNDDIYQAKAFTSPIQSQNAFCVAAAAISLHSLTQALLLSKLYSNNGNFIWIIPNKSNPMSLSAIAETVAFSNHRYNGAATTLALVYRLMDGNQVTIKHIGDSRVYLQRDNQWQCLTQDHTVLNELKKRADGILQSKRPSKCL